MCLVLWFCVVLCNFWFRAVSCGFMWFCLVLCDFVWFCVVLVWFYVALRGFVLFWIVDLWWLHIFFLVLNLIAIAYTAIRIVETHTVKAERPLWHELCSYSHVKDYVITVYKPRAQHKRFYIQIIFASFMVATCASQGENA